MISKPEQRISPNRQRKQKVAARVSKFAPMLCVLAVRNPADGITPFPSIRAQAVLRSGLHKAKREVVFKGPR